jgi:hypothetical protein
VAEKDAAVEGFETSAAPPPTQQSQNAQQEYRAKGLVGEKGGETEHHGADGGTGHRGAGKVGAPDPDADCCDEDMR